MLKLFSKKNEDVDAAVTTEAATSSEATEETEAKKVNTKKIAIICGSVAGALLVVFVGFGIFFQSHFFFRSTVNGVSSSAASASAIKGRLEDAAKGYELAIVDDKGKKQVLSSEDLGLQIDISEKKINALLEEQNGFLWVYRLFVPAKYMDDAIVSCDTKTLERTVKKLDCVTDKNPKLTENAKVSYKDGTFVVTKEVYGTEVEPKLLTKKIKKAALSLQKSLDLKKDKCYKQPKYTEDSKEVKELVKILNGYVDTKITYQVGSATESVPKETIGSWLSADDQMQPAFDAEKMKEFVSTMSKKYDTYGQPKQLATQYGTTVTVPGGNYGWRIDKDGEVAQLQEDIKAGKDVNRDFVYQYTAASHDGNDYGNSYVEINRTAQHVYLVINGSCVMDTPCVTGNPNNGHVTPCGAFRITYCERNAILKGANYRTPVSYWMPFNGDIGLHDATWQKSFGGQRYREGYGSHGCVNLPLSAAGTIFSYVQAGFPVLMYDLGGTETVDSLTQKQADDCKNAINAIGSVTTDSGAAISAARGAYDALTDSGKALVDNYQVLVDAEASYANIWAQVAAQQAEADAQNQANAVIALIDQIGTPVTADSKAKVDAAQNAYNALSDAAKAKVTNKATLDAAVAALKAL